MTDYLVHLSVIVAIYSILAIALNPVVVSLGSMNIANAALFGIGAYASAFASMHVSSELVFVVLFASVCSTFLALGLGFVSYLLRDDEFAVFTMLFQLVFVVVLSSLDWLGSTRGLLNLQPFQIAGARIDAKLEFLGIALAFLIVWILIDFLLFGSRYRILAVAARTDQILLESMGWSALRLRLRIFALSGFGAGLAGILYAHYFTFLEPHVFSLGESFFVILAVSFLGRHGRLSPMLGALVLIAFPESLRFLGLRSVHSGPIIQIVFACLLFLVLMNRVQVGLSLVRTATSDR